MNRLEKLRAALAAVTGKMRAINDATSAGESVRDFTAEEQKQYDDLRAEHGRLQAAIDREALLAASEATAAPVATVNGNGTNASGAPSVRIELGQERRELDAQGGFQSFGEFAQCVIQGSLQNGRIDPRLRSMERDPRAAAPSTYGGEGVGTDGGFLLPPQYASDIFTLSQTDDSLLPYTDGVTVSGNSMVFPKDETTPWGTDGVRAYWQAEAVAATATKPKFGATMLRLHKLMGLVPLTNELIDDGSALASYITPLIARSVRWKTNEALLFGTGNGQPLGMLTGATTGAQTTVAGIVQAKDAAQAANTLSMLNFANMASRLPAGAGPSLWLITPDAFPLLFTLTIGNVPAYLPFNQPLQASVMGDGATGTAAEGMLLGRPVFKSQHAAALSAQGDVILVAPQWYRTITKSGEGITTASSMHLYFDADAMAFRATFRIDGQPKLLAPIAQAKGSKTLSPFIALEAR